MIFEGFFASKSQDELYREWKGVDQYETLGYTRREMECRIIDWDCLRARREMRWERPSRPNQFWRRVKMMEWSTVSKAADESRRINEWSVFTKIHCKDKAIVNFKKSSFRRMKNPISRMKRRQGVRRQVRVNAGGNNVFENFGNEVGVWIQTKVVEISVNKDVFEKRLERACLKDDGKIPPETERLTSFELWWLDQVCIEAEFQKESWDGIKGTLFTFKSTFAFANFSEKGWNKIDQLRWRGGGGAGGIWNGSGKWDGKNLVRMARKDVSIWGLWIWVRRISVNSRYLLEKSTPQNP